MTCVENSGVRGGNVLVQVTVPAPPPPDSAALRTTKGSAPAGAVLAWAVCARGPAPALTFTDAPVGLRVLELDKPVRTRSARDVQQRVPLTLTPLHPARPAHVLRLIVEHAASQGIGIGALVIVMDAPDGAASAVAWPQFELAHVQRLRHKYAAATFVAPTVVALEACFGVSVVDDQQRRPTVTAPLPPALAGAGFETLHARNVRLGAQVLVKRCSAASGAPTVTLERADDTLPVELLLVFTRVPRDAAVPVPSATLDALARVDALLPLLTHVPEKLQCLLQARKATPHAHAPDLFGGAFRPPHMDRFTSARVLSAPPPGEDIDTA